MTNTLAAMLKEGKTGTPEYSELKRRFGWEFNGMRLHELYFENLGGKAFVNKAGKFARKAAEAFGTLRYMGAGLPRHGCRAEHRLGGSVPGQSDRRAFQRLG